MSTTSLALVATAVRHGATAPIHVAPRHRPVWKRALRFVRRRADRLNLAFASAIVVGVFVQVYLIGSSIFGAGQLRGSRRHRAHRLRST